MTLAREIEFLAWEEGGHILKLHSVTDILWLQAVDLVHVDKRKIFLTLFWWVDNTTDGVTWLQSEELICVGDT